MEYRTLGRTGLKVSVMGIGAGGPSRLGQRYDTPEADSIAIIREALDAGVNFIDTAEAYGTEDIVGKAITGYNRDSLVISTKKSTHTNPTPEDVRRSLETSLNRLRTDYVDVYHLHGVTLKDYDYLLAEIVPVMQDLRDQGKIRHIGITEAWNSDTTHATLERALQDHIWDVMMVGFNLLNQSARERVFQQTIRQHIGVLVMFAVRMALSKPDRLVEVMRDLIQRGEVDESLVDPDKPLDFLLDHAASIPDAAYRFCMNEPGTHVILSGTGNIEHLRANLESFSRPPLPEDVVARLRTIFRRVDSITGQ